MQEYEAYYPDATVWRTSTGRLVVLDSTGITKPDSYVERIEVLGVSDLDYELLKEEQERDYMLSQERDSKTPEPVVKKPGYIYAVKCGTKLKLGRSKKPELRFKQYRKLTDDFVVIKQKYVADHVKAEKAMLTFFRNGEWTEWFDYTPEFELSVLQYFDSVKEVKNEG